MKEYPNMTDDDVEKLIKTMYENPSIRVIMRLTYANERTHGFTPFEALNNAKEKFDKAKKSGTSEEE